MNAKLNIPAIAGSTIVRVRPMTDVEASAQGWTFSMDGAPLVIELDTGVVLFPSQDPEGNGPGCVFGDYQGTGFYVGEDDPAPKKKARRKSA